MIMSHIAITSSYLHLCVSMIMNSHILCNHTYPYVLFPFMIIDIVFSAMFFLYAAFYFLFHISFYIFTSPKGLLSYL